MAFWQRWFGSAEAEEEVPEEGILVISDIHLGEDVLISGPEHLGSYIQALNRELADFIAAHIGGRPWHLVVNGDMFDFVKVSVQPSPEEAFEHWSRQLTDEELQRLPNTQENVVYKLGRILEIHRPLFKQFARFVLAGNRITIIEGNHDTEFYFEAVRQRLHDFVVSEVERIQKQERPPDKTLTDEEIAALKAKAVAAAARLNFQTWFEASSGRYHIEHGHQYDELCSFEYNLVPVAGPGENPEIATPMSHRVMPYFAELLGDFSTHGVDHWSLGDWLKFCLKLGPRMMLHLTKVYFVATWELISQAGNSRAEQIQSLSKLHKQRLRAMAECSAYGYETLRQLDQLKAKPAEFSMFKMARVFFFDRFVIVGATALLMTLSGLLGGTAWCLASMFLGSVVLLTSVFTPNNAGAIEEILRLAAARIADLTGARYVVFGHSHHPELVDLRRTFGVGRFGENAYYINSGSWVTREVLRGDASQGMTYVELTGDGARLRRWLGANRTSTIVASTVAGEKNDTLSLAALSSLGEPLTGEGERAVPSLSASGESSAEQTAGDTARAE